MYTIRTRIFGKYLPVGYEETYHKALDVAQEQFDKGWLYVQIEHPNGLIEDIGEYSRILAKEGLI